jgi:hypothetical protein
MNREFPDNSKTLFGREPDLAYLSDRAGHSGMTAVVGRAQMGKSWLLTELVLSCVDERKKAMDGHCGHGAWSTRTVQPADCKR